MVVTVTRVLAVLAALPSSMRVWTRTRRIETPYAVVVLAALCLVLLLAAFVVGFAWPASVVAVASLLVDALLAAVGCDSCPRAVGPDQRDQSPEGMMIPHGGEIERRVGCALRHPPLALLLAAMVSWKSVPV